MFRNQFVVRTGCLVALFGALSVLGGCGADDPASAATVVTQAANEFTPKVTGPQIEFESLNHHFGVISDTNKQRTQFRFRNVGSERLVIKDVKAACGCTVPTLDRYEFGPGEGTELNIVFDPKGKTGATDKYITVISNSMSDPDLKLHIQSDIKSLVEFERMNNLGTIPLGEGRKELVDLRYRDPDLQFVEVSVNNPSVTARIVESGVLGGTDTQGEPMYQARLEVDVDKGAPWGLLYATRVTMKVRGRSYGGGDPVDYSYDMYLLGSVYGELHAKTGIISLGNVSPGQSFRASVELSRITQQPFSIASATITDTTMPGLTARAEPLGDHSYRIFVQGPTAGFVGSVRGIVTLQTDVPGEERIELRFAGQVR